MNDEPICTFPQSNDAEKATKLIKIKKNFKIMINGRASMHGKKETEDKRKNSCSSFLIDSHAIFLFNDAFLLHFSQ